MISNAQPRPNPLNGIRSPQLQISRTGSEGSKSPALSLPGGFDDGGTEDWGGDLMDVNDDAADWGQSIGYSVALSYTELVGR